MRWLSTFLMVLGGMVAYGQQYSGFFDFSWNDTTGKITLEIPIDQLNEEFLYVSSLSAGIGSNDIGLDRGQLGDDRIVQFEKHGPKVLLVQLNQDYRAITDNDLERKAVREAFAQSVLWGFNALKSSDSEIIRIDLTPFLIQDVHGVTQRLKRTNQGAYKLDKNRSAIWLDRTRSFPDNSEFEALLTFTGESKGQWIRSVAPNADAVTVRQHHSFIRLPDDQYKPRPFHPYSGYNSISYADYATPIESPIRKRLITRHRLEKKDPNVAVSEAVEPIIYYMDPGCPEPIKGALMEGARWWDQAFRSAGYAPGTFQVRELPPGADMLDVRYNVIQWVHRSTRGWSYGSSVRDPRTGEIIKGHVSLGSLRVRQDFLIAQGLLSPYGEDDDNHDAMKELALARLRQLSAHEVGHTIGLSHNFASSVNDRASVMDYPHPYIELTTSGKVALEKSYDDKIGEWDKFTIQYGYQDFPEDQDEMQGLQQLILDTQGKGFHFISDRDARPQGGAHPGAHLWDNGVNAAEELNRMMTLRKNAMRRFGESTITKGTPLSELEKVLVPLYLMHRYQMEAVSKVIGGLNYEYFVKGDGYTHTVSPVEVSAQGFAMRSILNTLNAPELAIPQHIVDLIPPPAHGFRRDRETFKSRTNVAFDALAPAESYSHMVFNMLLNSDRMARIHRHNIAHNHPLKLDEYLWTISSAVFSQQSVDLYFSAIENVVKYALTSHLLKNSYGKGIDPYIVAESRSCLQKISDTYLSEQNSFNDYLKFMITQGLEEPDDIEIPVLNSMPPGSPIGCGG